MAAVAAPPAPATARTPRRSLAALRIVGPLHLVEHEHLDGARRHLDRAADARGRIVGTLLAGDWTWLATFSRLLAARPPEPPAVVLAALPPAEQAAMRELWRARTLLLEDQRRFLASEVTPYR